MASTTDIIYRYLTTDNLPADGTNQSMRVNGSVTPVKFYLRPPSLYNFDLTELLLEITDTKAWDPEDFGKIAGPLANGVKLELLDKDDGLILDFTGGLEILDNATLRALGTINGGSVDEIQASVDETWFVRIMLPSIQLKGRSSGEGSKLQITVQDDLTGLIRFCAIAFGEKAQIRRELITNAKPEDEAYPKESPWIKIT